MGFKLKWFGTACFEMVLADGSRVVTDPYITDCANHSHTWEDVEGCDYIFITHGHFDHVLDIGALVKKFNPKIFCSSETGGAIIEHQNASPENIHEIEVGDVVRENGLTVEVLTGIHVDFVEAGRRLMEKLGQDASAISDDPEAMLDKVFAGATRPDKLEEWMTIYPPGPQLNFVFDADAGKRIFLAGSYPDPSLIEVAQKANADITLLQVMGGRILDGLEQATFDLAKASGCSMVVPQHHDPLMVGLPETDLTKLKSMFSEKSDIEFKEFEYARWYEFD